MASQFYLNVFDAEIFLKSHRNLFPESVPTASEVFEKLKSEFDAKQLPTLEYTSRKTYISKFEIEAEWVKILFHLTDPSVRDRDYSDIRNRTLRTTERNEGEEPAFSSHVLINTNVEHDISRSYPCIIEEVEILSRTLIAAALNTYIGKSFLDEQRPRPHKGDTKSFRVTAQLQAPLDQTLGGIVENGGILEGVKFTEQSLAGVVDGDETYAVQEERSVFLKIAEPPTHERAIDFLKSFYAGFDRGGKKTLKVIVYDPENETQKTVAVRLGSRLINL